MSHSTHSMQSIETRSEPKEVPRFKIKQNHEMDLQSDFQALCIYLLLLNNATIEIGLPNRIAHLTKQFIKIKKISFSSDTFIQLNSNSTSPRTNFSSSNSEGNNNQSNDLNQMYKTKDSKEDTENEIKELNEINVLEYIQKRSKEQVEYQQKYFNVASKTAERRIQTTKRRECMRLLQDLLFEFGYFIEVQNETVYGYDGKINIYFNNKLLYDAERVKIVGDTINKKISKLLKLKQSLQLTSSSLSFLVQE